MSGLEALGGATAIFQTISFTREVYGMCYNFYDDRPVAFDSLSTYAEDMKRANASIQQHIEQLSPKRDPDDKDLLDVLQRTRDAAAQLHSEIAYVLGKRRAGSISKAIRTLYRYRKKKVSIAALKSTLEDCDRATNRMIANRNIKQSDVLLFQQSTGFSHLSSNVKDLVQQLADQRARAEVNHQQLRSDFADLSLGVAQSSAETRSHVDEILSRQAEEEKESQAHRQLLESLKFPEMLRRENDIVNPRDASFKDEFFRDYWPPPKLHSKSTSDSSSEDSNTADSHPVRPFDEKVQEALGKLRDWVNTGTTPFWISGRAGSGKSVLVKFLAAQERKYWKNQPERKEILTHYFFRAGSAMEQNKKGYFCSLTHQLLREHPDRLRWLLRDDKDLAQKKSLSDWSIAELRDLFQKIITSESPSTTFILFIDGLDEMTEVGDLEDLFKMLEWQQGPLPNCRFCVSSRPEHIIQAELSQYPTIRVQELTYWNMMAYTRAKLGEAVRKKGWGDNDVRRLFSQIVGKAEGIFLWLVFVIDILRQSIARGKDYEYVLQRLTSMPTKLEALFQDMWDRMGVDFASDQPLAASYINAVVVYRRAGEASRASYVEGSVPLIDLILAANPEKGEQIMNGGKGRLYRLSWLEARREEIASHCMGLLVCRPPGLEHHRGSNPHQPAAWMLNRYAERKSREYEANQHDKIQFKDDEDGQENKDDTKARLDLLLSQEVLFMHRSAYDFFTKTKAGQSICDKSGTPYASCCLSLVQGWLTRWRFANETLERTTATFNTHYNYEVRFALSSLSEAVDSEPGALSEAADLLYQVFEMMYRWDKDERKHYISLAMLFPHMLEMLSAPAVAATQIGSFLFSDYWRQRHYLPAAILEYRPSPRLVVERMISGGATPDGTVPNYRYSWRVTAHDGAFLAFLMHVWCTLIGSVYFYQSWSGDHGPTFSSLSDEEGSVSPSSADEERPVSPSRSDPLTYEESSNSSSSSHGERIPSLLVKIHGWLEALDAFLAANPRLDARTRVAVSMHHSEFYTHQGDPGYYNVPFDTRPGTKIVLIFSVQAGWLLRHTLATYRTITGSGDLTEIEERIRLLEERQGYREERWELSHAFSLAGKRRQRLFYRTQFDEPLATWIADCVSAQLERMAQRTTQKMDRQAHDEIRWAVNLVVSGVDIGGYPKDHAEGDEPPLEHDQDVVQPPDKPVRFVDIRAARGFRLTLCLGRTEVELEVSHDDFGGPNTIYMI